MKVYVLQTAEGDTSFEGWSWVNKDVFVFEADAHAAGKAAVKAGETTDYDVESHNLIGE